MRLNDLTALAQAAGIETEWRDVRGEDHVVNDATLRAVLKALGLPADSTNAIAHSMEELRREREDKPRPLITATVGTQIFLPGRQGVFELTLESGAVLEGVAASHNQGVTIPAIQEPGYHSFRLNNAVTIIAVAPQRGYTLNDAAKGEKIWGLAVQLYALRRHRGGSVGDFAALAQFAEAAAKHGANALAISPVHAQFSSDVTRYGPYAPSSRAALNVMHIPLDTGEQDNAQLIDWPETATNRLQRLREEFQQFSDLQALDEFRRGSGSGLHLHAVFEALSAALSAKDPAALDYRNWPQAFQNPESREVSGFMDANLDEIDFHIWLQFRADMALKAAQDAATRAGMKIGLIADLAVGASPTGSQSWSRHAEVLQGLQVGAPPDLFNTTGQSWGITAFSPRGLRNSGFSAFIDMLRHALRHAGGVRIDHVMGLARLWVIPEGFSAADGAYLRLPADDLMRIVALESHRHKAVVIGEDLGTLPEGFGDKLEQTGIAGMRVLWFERENDNFVPPGQWTQDAVAMTTTHDLPTVAGWWTGADIDWREKLGIATEDAQTRAADRAKLWAAFQASGAAKSPMPDAGGGAAAADAACAHLGRAASTLVLLPIEDALASTDQPNIPGTIDEHPNWRRRLPGDADTLFARPDVAARLAALNAARRQS